MFEYYNNILCVQANWLIESGVVSKCNYDNLKNRSHIRVLQRGGNGRLALVQFDNMRSDIKQKVIEVVGYDPKEKVKNIHFIDYLIRDTKAVKFFDDYTLDNGEALPEKAKAEYVANASVLNTVKYLLENRLARRRALGNQTTKVWETLTEIISNLPQHEWPHSLPANFRRLKEKYKTFHTYGYDVLIHKGFGAKNAERINDEAKSFVLARWCDRVKRVANYAQLLREYNQQAESEGWKLLKSEQTLKNFLTDPKIEPLWWGYRYGELNAKEKFSIQLTTKLPSLRDSLWYSDGTKLNYYFLDADGKVSTCQVYEVMDAYSEVLLGYHISKSEDFEAQFYAYKMAVKNAGHRPYQLGFDNQGGHKKLENGNFLNRLCRLAIKTQPYNGKSKTIESAFGRFQSQFLKQDWFFTGQNITTKKEESRANMEFILSNKSNLPSLNEIKEVYAKRRQEWNSAPHPSTGKARIDMYLESVNPETSEITPLEMVDVFWIEREKPITLSAYGLSFTEKKVKYNYWVYDQNRLPNVKWMSQNIDKKFIVKFDPEDMSLIYLYEKTALGLRLVTAAETKAEVSRGKQEQTHEEAQLINYVLEQNKAERINRRDQADANLAEHQMTAEHYGLNSPALKGIESSRKQKQKTPKTERQKELVEIGAFQKSISNMVYQEEDEEYKPKSLYDIL